MVTTDDNGSEKLDYRTARANERKKLPEGRCYCRRCMEVKPEIEFLKATDLNLDMNGKMSICKKCVSDMYQKLYELEQQSVQRAMFKLCRILNWKYSEVAIDAVMTQMKTKERGEDDHTVPTIYRAKLVSTQHVEFGKRATDDLTFVEPVGGVNLSALDQDLERMGKDNDYSQEEVEEQKKYFERFWGKGLSLDDYLFLEEELADWQRTHKSDTKAEITLLKEICYKTLEIRKARFSERSTNALVTELQAIMKTAAVDPAKTAVAGSGKSQDTFSGIIEMIEQNDPADYYQDKDVFKDYDNLEYYFKKYMTRPLKNFVTSSRDFNVEEDEKDEGEEEYYNDIEKTGDENVEN